MGTVIGAVGVVITLLAWLLPQDSSSSEESTPSPTTSSTAGTNDYALEFSVDHDEGWATSASVIPSALLQFQVRYQNTSRSKQNDVVVIVELPRELTYLTGSTRVINDTNPNGRAISDNVAERGVNIGAYAPGGAGYVAFAATVAPGDRFPCNPRTLAPQATVLVGDESASAEAIMRVQKRC